MKEGIMEGTEKRKSEGKTGRQRKGMNEGANCKAKKIMTV